MPNGDDGDVDYDDDAVVLGVVAQKPSPEDSWLGSLQGKCVASYTTRKPLTTA